MPCDLNLYRASSVMRVFDGMPEQGLVFADPKAIKEHCIGLGAGEDLYALFAAVLTMRPWDKNVDQTADHLAVPDTQEGKDELQVHTKYHL